MKSSPRPFRILITDNVVINAGDAAILLAMKDSLEAAFGPHAEVRCTFNGPPNTLETYRTLYPELHLLPTITNAAFAWPVPSWNLFARMVRKTAIDRFMRAAEARRQGRAVPMLLPAERKLLEEFAEADLVVVTGGAPLSTSWTQPRARAERIGQYLVALELGKPLALYAMSVGPFTADDPFPDMLRPIMEQAVAVLCREEEAVRVVRERVGIATPNVHQTIDEAMLLTSRPPTKPIVPPQKTRRRIGVCVHQWHWLGDSDPEARQRAFESRMAAVCRELLEEGDTDLVFLTTHQGVEGIHRDDDVSERICAQLPESLRPLAHVTHEFIHPREFAYIMGQCDLAISSRLHGAIMSLVGGAPVIAFAYEPKTRGLMRQLDLEDCVLEMGDATAEEILALARELLRDPAATRARFDAGVAKGRVLARRNQEILKDALSPKSESLPPAQAA
jgi:colanic acid/amylovoran biosynthesis protein